MTTGTIVIVGAGSGIARACAEAWAARGHRLVLVGRRIDDLQRTAADLALRFRVNATVEAWDAQDPATTLTLVERLRQQGPLQTVLVAHGYMAEQRDAEADPALAVRMITVNLTAVVDLVERLIPSLPTDGTATLALISSVAGDRGRQSNYIYGCTKAGLTAYADGLRNRLFHQRIHVVTVKPGFVATAMTAGKVKVGSPLVAQPAQVAADILRAVDRKQGILYTRWFWRWIMLIITSIPDTVFKRLRL